MYTNLDVQLIKHMYVLRGGGPSRKIFRTYIWGFYVSKNYIKKEKFRCRLEQNRTTGGRVARANAKLPKMDPNFENGHFSSLFKNNWTMCFVLIFYTHMPNFGVLGSKTAFLEPKTCFFGFSKISIYSKQENCKSSLTPNPTPPTVLNIFWRD